MNKIVVHSYFHGVGPARARDAGSKHDPKNGQFSGSGSGGGATPTAHKGYALKHNPIHGEVHVSKGGSHIATYKNHAEAIKGINELTKDAAGENHDPKNGQFSGAGGHAAAAKSHRELSKEHKGHAAGHSSALAAAGHREVALQHEAAARHYEAAHHSEKAGKVAEAVRSAQHGAAMAGSAHTATKELHRAFGKPKTAKDAETKHDPKNGQFSAGGGSGSSGKVDHRELGKQKKISLGSYKPKVGEHMDFYGEQGNKHYGKIEHVSPTHVTVRHPDTKKLHKMQIVKGD